MDAPLNFIELAVVARNTGDSGRLRAALDRLRVIQPWIEIRVDAESGQTVLAGKSEEQLESAVSVLAAECRLNAYAPQVAYRETLLKSVTILYTHKKQTGGSGQFAEVKIEFEPLPAGSGFKFENDVVGGSIPTAFIPAIEKGLKAEKETGIVAGFPVIDFRARLVDGKYHEVDSNPLTFEIAARAAFRELATKRVGKLLEPVIRVDVVTPPDFAGAVLALLLDRRGHILSQQERGDDQVISAMAPMSTMFGFARSLHAYTDRRGRYEIAYDHYEAVPHFSGDDPRFPGAAAMRIA